MNEAVTPETPDTDDKPIVIPFRSDRATRQQLDEVVGHMTAQLGVKLDRSKVLRRLVAEAHRKMRKS